MRPLLLLSFLLIFTACDSRNANLVVDDILLDMEQAKYDDAWDKWQSLKELSKTNARAQALGGWIQAKRASSAFAADKKIESKDFVAASQTMLLNASNKNTPAKDSKIKADVETTRLIAQAYYELGSLKDEFLNTARELYFQAYRADAKDLKTLKNLIAVDLKISGDDIKKYSKENKNFANIIGRKELLNDPQIQNLISCVSFYHPKYHSNKKLLVGRMNKAIDNDGGNPLIYLNKAIIFDLAHDGASADKLALHNYKAALDKNKKDQRIKPADLVIIQQRIMALQP